MDKLKEGLGEAAKAPQRGAQDTQNTGQQATDAAKDKTQGRPGQNLKSTVEDKLRSEGERFMQGGTNK